jgi:hypothetical protein
METTFYQDARAVVSNTDFMTNRQTHAMSGITSVSESTNEPNRFPMLMLTITGLVTVHHLFGLVTLSIADPGCTNPGFSSCEGGLGLDLTSERRCLHVSVPPGGWRLFFMRASSWTGVKTASKGLVAGSATVKRTLVAGFYAVTSAL